MRSPLRELGILVTIAALTTGCVAAKPPGVAIRSLPSNIVFGVKLPVAAAPPTFPTLDATPPPVDTTPPIRPPRRRPVIPVLPPEDCPDALDSAFPAQAASLGVDHAPVAGSYRWKNTIELTVQGTPLTTTAFSTHLLTNVSPVTQTANPVPGSDPTVTFTFDDVQLFTTGAKKVTTYQVKEHGIQYTQVPPAGPGGLGAPVQVGEPDRGVALTKVVDYDPTGAVQSTFSPTPPVLLLPLDVIATQQFQSVGSDPVSGASFEVNGTVLGRARVDACGSIVDGWEVQSQQVFTSADGQAQVVDVTYDVATQLGGMLTRIRTSQRPEVEQAKAAAGQPLDPVITASIAQLKPGPLPKP